METSAMKSSRHIKYRKYMSEQPEFSTKKTSIQFGCMSWPAIALTIAIIGIRAFQPNAEPMSQWSGWSWCLMCLPIFFPFLMWIGMIVLYIFGILISELLK